MTQEAGIALGILNLGIDRTVCSASFNSHFATKERVSSTH